MERKEREEMEQAVLKQEDPEVEYKRRLVERFTYKNTDMIQRIYAENQVRTLCYWPFNRRKVIDFRPSKYKGVILLALQPP